MKAKVERKREKEKEKLPPSWSFSWYVDPTLAAVELSFSSREALNSTLCASLSASSGELVT